MSKWKKRCKQLEVQLAGCGVAARGHVSEEYLAHSGDYGWSPAYQDVVDLRISYQVLLSEKVTRDLEKPGCPN